MRKPFFDYDLNNDKIIAVVETSYSKNVYFRNRHGVVYIAKTTENEPCFIDKCSRHLGLDFWLYCGHAYLLTVYSETLMNALANAKNLGKFRWDVRDVKYVYKGCIRRAGISN